MNNIELEQKVKAIIEIPNMFDMIIAAKKFEKEYKTSDFYKTTHMPIYEVVNNAKKFYLINVPTIKAKAQEIINGLDYTTVNQMIDNFGKVFTNENQEVARQLEDLQDFKQIIKNNTDINTNK